MEVFLMGAMLALVVWTILGGCGGADSASSSSWLGTPFSSGNHPAGDREPMPDLTAMGPEEQRSYLMALGKTVYETGGSGGIPCSTCHQLDGRGTSGAFPPLVGQREIMGECGQHATYVIKGLTGKIRVNGIVYNGAMPAQPNLSDLEVAAVITYERNSWGNDYGMCLPETVAAIR
jgi:mono/diheme cytochrome c family protein